MGHVDQADVKAHVMGLTMLMSRDWHDKQLYQLIEFSVISSHTNYNLDPHQEIKPEFFTEWHNNPRLFFYVEWAPAGAPGARTQ